MYFACQMPVVAVSAGPASDLTSSNAGNLLSLVIPYFIIVTSSVADPGSGMLVTV